MVLFDGKKEALKIEETLVAAVSGFSDVPILAIVQIGENASSEKYIKLKMGLC